MAILKTETKTKDPHDVLDYKLDWSDWLANTPTTSDTITSSTWTVPTGITENSSTNDTTSTTIWLSGGTDGTDYTLINKVVTNGGRTAEVELTIQVRE
jgi:hypothetical protein